MKSALFWDITQRRLAIPCRRFGTTFRFHLRGPRSHLIFFLFLDFSTLDDTTDRLIGCPETSVRNYSPTLHKIPEQRRSQKSKNPDWENWNFTHTFRNVSRIGRDLLKLVGREPRFIYLCYLFTYACALLNDTVCISQTSSVETFNDYLRSGPNVRFCAGIRLE
jgi:hypothetical protein